MPIISPINVSGVGIGFANLTYIVNEGSEVEVCARVDAGMFVSDVIVTIHTEPGTATTAGMFAMLM